MTSSLKSIADRRQILHHEISKYVQRGFRVVSQSDTTAQLIKPKRFSLFWAIAWLFFFGIGILIYLFYYWSKRDESVYLEVDELGRLRKR